jgi:hypothetical protein
MNQKHIVNIGLPRCGTTWLWHQLCSHPALNYTIYQKENPIFFDQQEFTNYKNSYNDHNVSANFQANLWMLDQALIKFLHQYVTHISVVLRNPYQFIERFFDFISHNFSQEDFVEWAVSTQIVNYQKFLSRWMDTAPSYVACKIFYFDDIEKDPTLFVSNYLEFCGLEVIINNDPKILINQNVKSQKIKINFSKRHISTINDWIDAFSDYADQDLAHWKL